MLRGIVGDFEVFVVRGLLLLGIWREFCVFLERYIAAILLSFVVVGCLRRRLKGVDWAVLSPRARAGREGVCTFFRGKTTWN